MKRRHFLFFQFSVLLVLMMFYCGAAFGQVSVTVSPINPPIIIPGGSFNFNLSVHNQTSQGQRFDLWCMIIYPDSTVHGPVMGPMWLRLPPNATATRVRSGEIASTAPVGIYHYTAYVGSYPNVIWNSSSFQIEKLQSVIPQWQARYNGTGNSTDGLESLAIDSSGNVYVTGMSDWDGNYHYNYLTIKYNAAGATQWVASYEGGGGDEATSIAVDQAGNVYVTGLSAGTGTGYDIVTVKYNAAGVQQWVNRYGGVDNEQGCDIQVDPTGNCYVVGFTDINPSGKDIITIKYNTAGVEQWVADYNSPNNSDDEPNALVLDQNNNVYVTGESNSDYITIKYDTNGAEQWAASYNGPGNSTDYGAALAVDSNKNVYVTGTSVGLGTSYDYATIKYDSTGAELWIARFVGYGAIDFSVDLGIDQTGNVFVTGYSDQLWRSCDYTTIKYNPDGVQQWVVYFGGEGEVIDQPRSLTMDIDGGVIVTGRVNGGGGGWNPPYFDYGTVKYSTTGVRQWIAIYNGPLNWYDEPNVVVSDQYGNVYVAGGSDSDYLTIKYSQGSLADWEPVEELVLGSQPQEFEIKQNFPNPFNPTTNISFSLATDGIVNLTVFDVTGRAVATLVDGYRQAGPHEVTFDGTGLASGVYVYQLTAGDHTASGKMVLLK